NWSLAAFQRVALAKGEKKTVFLTVQPHELEAVNEQGQRQIESGSFQLFAGISQPDDRSVELTGTSPLSYIVHIK
ncbi:MAG: fibronectin type III-like domain-contianing protein, partial [Clostridiales bacterium]|nr:fibronectin type III-like domain-contianing protein [Clostridiales bacterium]